MPRVCIHLANEPGDQDHAQLFTGVGTDHALICLACRQHPESIDANLVAVSAERFAEVEEAGSWAEDEDAIVGRPQILERPTPLRFEHRELLFSAPSLGKVAALRPVAGSADGAFLVLGEGGDLLRVEPARGTARRLLNVGDAGEALQPGLSLHASPCGTMAAVVETRGRSGVVFDLEDGRPSMQLDRGNHHPEQSDFPVAFFEVDGRSRLIHGTDWNRLDISDARTGECLTTRAPTSYETGEARPEHFLDYFHGGLLISPGGDWVLDNGWAWHPSGVVTSWSLGRWLRENPWESEDGPTRKAPCHRAYFWNGPACWVGDRTVAVWGYGNDDENLIPAALLFDVESGRRLRWFAGPAGSFTFDKYLFSSSPEAGTAAWDVATGERLLDDPTLRPTAYHPGSREFITIIGEGRIRISRLVGDP